MVRHVTRKVRWGPSPHRTVSQWQTDEGRNDCRFFGLFATAISLGFTGAEVAAREVTPKVMTAGEAVYTENCAHCHKATGQCDGGAAPTLAGYSVRRHLPIT